MVAFLVISWATLFKLWTSVKLRGMFLKQLNVSSSCKIPFFASDKVVFFDKYVLHINKFSNDSLKVVELNN